MNKIAVLKLFPTNISLFKWSYKTYPRKARHAVEKDPVQGSVSANLWTWYPCAAHSKLRCNSSSPFEASSARVLVDWSGLLPLLYTHYFIHTTIKIVTIIQCHCTCCKRRNFLICKVYANIYSRQLTANNVFLYKNIFLQNRCSALVYTNVFSQTYFLPQ